MFSRRKRGGQPLVIEDCWAIKKTRINGCRKKRSYGDEPELDDAAVQNEQELDDVVMQNEAVVDLVMHHDQHLDDDVVQTEAVVADVLQTKTETEDVLQTEAVVADVMQTEPICKLYYQLKLLELLLCKLSLM